MTTRRFTVLVAAAITMLLAGVSTASAALRAPRLQSPASGASVQSLPAFTWSNVRGAAQYQFEFAADKKFSSTVTGFAQGPITTNGPAITDDRTIPNGTYYWRARGVTASDRLGAWSTIRMLRKNWTDTPGLVSPNDGTTVSWPTSPLVLHWNAVPYAVQYDVWIATDPGLSNIVLGSVGNPTTTQGTVFAFPTTLAPGQYYWAITPVDAEGNTGPRSPAQSFIWTWPSNTNVNESNSSTDATVVNPELSWNPVPGAASYQVQINSAPDFPAGSQWCCTDQAIGTSLIPTQFLPNATTLYWRVRAIDVRGDGGQWNVGQPFTESFDQQNPTITNLNLVDVNGNPIATGSATQTPIITWSPVPGASSYEFELTAHQPQGCDWSGGSTSVQDTSTATTAWTPFAQGKHVGPTAWPGPENGSGAAAGLSYCFRVLARRDDGVPGGGQVISDWTQLGGNNGVAFNWTPPPSPGAAGPTPASAYVLPSNPSVSNPTVTSTPLFTWNAVPGAGGYYVVVARDSCFTDVVDVGYTNVTAYAPRVGNLAPYADETNAYYYAIIPSNNPDGSGVFSDPECSSGSEDSPQSFTKFSIPPGSLSVGGSATDPTFQWSSAQTARNYTLQVAADPSFSNPLVQVLTDSTSYTTEAMLPAGTLFWRVRANDVINQGLNWSATASFNHQLAVPTPAASNATGGETIPALSWSPVDGAISYSMHVDQSDGTTRDFTVNSPVLSPTFWWGTGIWRWEVRANFPNQVSGAYFSPESQYVRVENAPTGVRATKSGTRIIISWNPDPNAKQYSVQISTTEGFGQGVLGDTTDNTVWVPQITAQDAHQKLYWRVATIDHGNNTGAYASGVFNAPRHHKAGRHSCKRTKHHRCSSKKHKKKKRKHK